MKEYSSFQQFRDISYETDKSLQPKKKERDKYKPLIKSESVTIFQKKDKTLIVNENEFTFQTKDRIIKRERPK